MGRKSLQIKKQKRFAQKMKRKYKSSFSCEVGSTKSSTTLATSNSPQSSPSSVASSDTFGSPGSPPNSVTSSDTFGSPESPPSSVASSDTFGSPGSPPSSVASSEQAHDTIIGLDTTAYQYDCDVMDEFTLVNGDKLSGDALVSHLKWYNSKLSTKVRGYHKECESLRDQVHKIKKESRDSNNSIRNFYRNMLFYGSSHGAKMLKASLNKWKLVVSLKHWSKFNIDMKRMVPWKHNAIYNQQVQFLGSSSVQVHPCIMIGLYSMHNARWINLLTTCRRIGVLLLLMHNL